MSVSLVPATMAQMIPEPIVGASCATWAPYMCNGELKFYEEPLCAKLCPEMPACEMPCPVSIGECSCSLIAGCECGEAPIDSCGCQTGCPPEANGPCMLVPPPNPFAGGDPLTQFGGVETRYWLPAGQEVKLFAQGDVEILATAGPTPGADQKVGDWIHSMRVLRASKTAVSVNLNRAAPLAPAMPIDSSLRLLNVSIAGRTMGSLGNATVDGLSVAAQRDTVKKIGNASAESIRITLGADFAVSVLAAKAVKFPSLTEQARHVHLDLFFDAIDKKAAHGVLPEIWGIAPMSLETKRLLVDPSTRPPAD